MSKIVLSNNFIKKTCKQALKEDLYPSGDITSNLLKNGIKKKVKLITNQNCILGGLKFAYQTFKLIDKKIKINFKKKEGANVRKGDVIATIEGNIKNILSGERVVINYISHISGIATKTHKFVKKVRKKTIICCTRKTIPNLRMIQKYGVKLGGGSNNRFNLCDEYMIKDNHIGAEEKFKEIIKKAIRLKKGRKITVEVDTIKQFKKIKGLKFNTVLFDNMSPKQLKLGVKLAEKLYETEASGGVNLNNVKKLAETGVNKISIGSLTHSAPAIDLKLEI